MTKRAFLLVDLQNDYFPGGKWPLVGIEAAAANAARLIAAARAAGDLVVHVRHLAPRPDAPFFLPGTEGAEIHAAVRPADGEPVVEKHFPNSFRETTLKEVLDGAGIGRLTIAGAMSHMCVDATARAAADFGYGVTVAHDACATRDLAFSGRTIPAAEVHGAFMAALGPAYWVVTSTAEILAAPEA